MYCCGTSLHRVQESVAWAVYLGLGLLDIVASHLLYLPGPLGSFLV